LPSVPAQRRQPASCLELLTLALSMIADEVIE
jgi:hypothetical protein